MLLKYLNQLEEAARRAQVSKDPACLRECAACLARLERYLASQATPIQQHGQKTVARLLPWELQHALGSQVPGALLT